jgi:hypothetical protein
MASAARPSLSTPATAAAGVVTPTVSVANVAANELDLSSFVRCIDDVALKQAISRDEMVVESQVYGVLGIAPHQLGRLRAILYTQFEYHIQFRHIMQANLHFKVKDYTKDSEWIRFKKAFESCVASKSGHTVAHMPVTVDFILAILNVGLKYRFSLHPHIRKEGRPNYVKKTIEEFQSKLKNPLTEGCRRALFKLIGDVMHQFVLTDGAPPDRRTRSDLGSTRTPSEVTAEASPDASPPPRRRLRTEDEDLEILEMG